MGHHLMPLLVAVDLTEQRALAAGLAVKPDLQLHQGLALVLYSHRALAMCQKGLTIADLLVRVDPLGPLLLLLSKGLTKKVYYGVFYLLLSDKYFPPKLLDGIALLFLLKCQVCLGVALTYLGRTYPVHLLVISETRQLQHQRLTGLVQFHAVVF